MCTCNEYKAVSSEKSFSPSLKFINSKLSRYNNQNAGSVPTCHILKCFPYYISSVCCIDMTENWSRQPFIDLPSGMKNCVLTWTELVLHSLPSCSDIPEGGKPSLGKRDPWITMIHHLFVILYPDFLLHLCECLGVSTLHNFWTCWPSVKHVLKRGGNFKQGKTWLESECWKISTVTTAIAIDMEEATSLNDGKAPEWLQSRQEKPHGRVIPSMHQNRTKILAGTCNLLHIRMYGHKTSGCMATRHDSLRT